MISLPEARRILASLPPLPANDQPVDRAVRAVLAEPVFARTPLPHASTSAMDGWALAAPDQEEVPEGPQWRVSRPGAEHPGSQLPPLQPGEAIGVVTGSPVPAGTVSVLRSEHGRLESGLLAPTPGTPDLERGRNIRPAGIEASHGQQLLSAGETLTPVRTALAAVAGYDTVKVHPLPRVEIITTGAEIITSGIPVSGQVRDTFTMSLPPMVAALGGQTQSVTRLDDDVAAAAHRFSSSSADLIITTGGTAHSRADAVRPALQQCRAEFLVDSVDMRPGHPVLSARLPSGTLVLGLPGNPLAGFAALTLLGRPLLRALLGDSDPLAAGVFTAEAGQDLSPARRGHRLLPTLRRGGVLHPTDFSRPHMLRGLARAEAFAVIPPEGVKASTAAECHLIPGQQTVGEFCADADITKQERQRKPSWDV